MNIPFGFCKCGCGQKTNINRRADKRFGLIKGQPANYIRGHSAKINPPRFTGYSDLQEAFDRYTMKMSEDECWPWIAAKCNKGYGVLTCHSKFWRAHRLSYTIHMGDIPKNMLVCHTCDNRSCVNPKHLFLGTNAENIQDMVNKGRASRGEDRVTNLTEQAVKSMRSLFNQGMSIADLARQFQVGYTATKNAVRGATWKHVI